MNDKLKTFHLSDKILNVAFVETQGVKEGVTCDIYSFPGDGTKDLAIVIVKRGYKTPVQRILLGDKTLEGFVSGSGTLAVKPKDGTLHMFHYPGESNSVVVNRGEIMQWHADDDTDLTFYEICEPPYADGRFENLATQNIEQL